ncbi:hypothetical protein OAF42_04435, partial [Planctomicrobium sp.]
LSQAQKLDCLLRQGRQEDKEQYPLVKTDVLVDRALYASIDPRPLESSVDPVVDPRGQNEPVREPVYKAPEEAVATTGRVFLQLAGAAEEDSTETELAAVTEEPEEDENVIDELRVRESVAGSGEFSEGYGVESSYESSAMELSMSGEDYSSTSYTSSIDGEGYPGMELDGEGVQAQKPRLNGQGYHFVSVRAVFPLRDQISKFADATNQSYQQAAANFDIIDFELQRQARQRGPNPWPEGEAGWEPVDIKVAEDILDTTAGYEADVVNSVVTNGVITMPLPMRISGAWRTQATHERIKNFELTDEQVKMEMQMNRALLEEAVQSKKNIRQSKVQRGGFSDFQFDSREIQGSLMGNENVYGSGMGMGMGSSYGSSSEMSMYEPSSSQSGRGSSRPGRGAASSNTPLDALISRLADDSEDPKEREKAIREWIMERASVDGELLLFRYFDFSVDPGKTYRYRVRFTLQNPNFGKRIADAGGLAHVVAGETRSTDWSNITTPVTVPEDLKYFLTRINEPRGNSRLLPSAQMDVYHWDSKYGTMVNKAFEVRMGQPIADEVEAEVIDAAGQLVEEMDYTFEAESFLVDAIEDINIDRNFHNNDRLDESLRLELVRGHRDHFRNQAQVLVKNDEGELEGHSESSNVKDHKYMKSYVEQQKETTFKHLFEQKTALTDAAGFGEYGDLMGEGSSYGEMSEMSMYGGNRDRSSLRKRSSSRGSGSSSRSRGSSSSSNY